MKKIVQSLLFSALALLIIVACSEDEPQIAPAKLEINLSEKNFGTVEAEKVASQEFIVTNKGGKDLVVKSIALSGVSKSDFSTTAKPTTITSGKTYKFSVSFKPTVVGNKTALVTVTTNVGAYKITLKGKATPKPKAIITVNPTSKNFTDTEVGKIKAQTFTITNTGNADLEITKFSLSGTDASQFTTNGVVKTIVPNGTYSFEATFSPTTVGGKIASLTIKTNVGDKAIVLSANALPKPVGAFKIDTTEKNYEDVIINKTKEHIFTIKNTGNASLEITAITLEGANSTEFSTNGTAKAIEPNKTYSFKATFKPLTVGVKAANIKIATKNIGDKIISLKGNATAVPVAVAVITPVTQNYGYLQIGKTTEQTFTVKNTGKANLKVTSISIVGTNKAEFVVNSVVKSIAPNKTYNFKAIFKPTTVGNKAASIKVVTNVGAKTINLSGKGKPEPLAIFTITPSTKNYGDVNLGQTSNQTFVVKNTGDANLVISGISIKGTNANQFSTNGGSKTIAPNQTYSFVTTFKPTRVGAKTASVKITTNVGVKTVNLNANAKPKPAPVFAVTPATKNYGELEVNKTAEQDFTIKNTGNATLKIVSFSLQGTYKTQFTTNGVAKTIAPNQTYTFKATFKPTTVGVKKASIALVTNAGIKYIKLNGTAKPEAVPVFTITPTSKSYGNLEINKTTEQAFVIKNTGNAVLKITSVALQGTNKTEFSTNGAAKNIAPNQIYSFKAVFKPTTVGSKSASIKIATNVGEKTVNLYGNAKPQGAPVFRINLTSKNFSNTILNQTKNQTFVITNAGNANLVITGISVQGANANQFNTNGGTKTIAPNTSYSFNAGFRPTAAGGKSASLRIATNVGLKIVSLSGNGVAAVQSASYSLTSTSLSFGNITNGSTSTAKTITIRNTGNTTLTGFSLAKTGANSAEFSASIPSNLSIPANGIANISVTFSPNSVANNKAASLAISCTQVTAAKTVSLSGNGTAATSGSFEIWAMKDDFGDNTIGMGYRQKVIIKNTGNTTLANFTSTLSGTGSNEFSVSIPNAISISPNGIARIEVRISPTSVGSKAVRLEISCNNAPSVTKNLSANVLSGNAAGALNIPNDTFKRQLLAHGRNTTINGLKYSNSYNNTGLIDTNQDGTITTAEANAYQGKITIYNLNSTDYPNVTDITGFEAFINLTDFYCTDNTKLTANTLDFSMLGKVKSITLRNAISVKRIILPNTNTLKKIESTRGYLENINLNACPNLEELNLHANALQSIDISNNRNLKELSVSYTKLTSLNVNGLAKLNALNVTESKLTTLDLSNNTALKTGSFYATGTPSLNCVKIPTGFTPPNTWKVDNTNIYSTICP